MPTGSRKVNIYQKKLMPHEAWDTYFLKYLSDKIDDTSRAAFLSRGVLDDLDITATGLSDRFVLDLSDASRGVDEAGHIMDLANIASSYRTVYFENANTVQYYVGFRYASIPTGIQLNPRSGEAEYPYYEDSIGELADPTSVTDNGTYLRLNLNSVFESGVDHSRREVMVYLTNPVSPTESVAYFTGTSAYSAPNNYVDIPYSALVGPLGQTAPTYPISTTASDYKVFVKGPTWRRNTDLRSDTNYVFLFRVTGVGAGGTPTVFDYTDQRKTFLISLDRAYRANSLDDPAPGRTIYADKQAVVIKQSATADRGADKWNTAFLIDKSDEEIYGFGMGVLSASSPTCRSLSAWKVLADDPDLLDEEAVTMLAGTATVNFTRVAVDLTIFEDALCFHGYCIISGTLNGTYDGLYYILKSTLTTNSFDVEYLDGSEVTFPAGTAGTCKVVIPTFFTNESKLVNSGGTGGISTVNLFAQNKNCHMTMALGLPQYPETTFFNAYGLSWQDYENIFFETKFLHQIMRGGGIYGRVPNLNGETVGHAHYLSDKRSGYSMEATLHPGESYSEWGYDYRGNPFGKDGTSDSPPYQLGGSWRIPYSFNNAGTKILAEEAFTQLGVNTLTLTRGGADGNYLIAGSKAVGTILAEVEYDSTNSMDGVYIVYSYTGNNVVFKKFDGTNPNFTAGTGKVRFYGGVWFGGLWASTPFSGTIGWVANITSPTYGSGGLRMAHRHDSDSATSSEGHFLLYLVKDAYTTMFAVRDAGQVYARALTTKADSGAGAGFAEWDSLVTGNLRADLVHLEEGTYSLEFPSTEASCNVITKAGGGSWTIDKVINVLRGQANLRSSGAPGWAPDTIGQYIYTPTTVASEWYVYNIPITIPQGATLTRVSFYINPGVGDGTANSLSVRVYRQAWNSMTEEDLYSGGQAYMSSTGIQTYNLTLDQNNVINNTTYEYWIRLKSSVDSGAPPPSDYLWGVQARYTADELGENIFDVV